MLQKIIYNNNLTEIIKKINTRFVKYSSYSYYPKDVLCTFKDDIIKFANIEGLDAHANSINVRFK